MPCPAPPTLPARREGLTQEQAERLVTDALALAMARDGSSGAQHRWWWQGRQQAAASELGKLTWAAGGLARLVTISAAGAKRRMVKGNDVPLFWDDIEPGNGNGNGIVIL